MSVVGILQSMKSLHYLSLIMYMHLKIDFLTHMIKFLHLSSTAVNNISVDVTDMSLNVEKQIEMTFLNTSKSKLEWKPHSNIY